MDVVNWVKTLSDNSDINLANEHIIQELIDENKITEDCIVRNSSGQIVTIKGIIVVESGQITLRYNKRKSRPAIQPKLLDDFFVSQKLIFSNESPGKNRRLLSHEP